MKKIIKFFFIFFLFLTSFAYTNDIIGYKTINIVKRTLRRKKKEINMECLYDTEEKIEKYVDFLLKEKCLDIDNEKKFDKMILEKKESWIILLFEETEISEGYIIDSFDTPMEYVLFIEKKTGKLSKLFLLLDR